MAKNLTVRQTNFLKIWSANGHKPGDAYKRAYNTKMPPHRCSVEGWKLLRNPKIKPFADKILADWQVKLEEAAETYNVSRARNVAELARIGYANLQDFMAVGPDGMPVLDWRNLTRAQAAALAEVTVTEVGRRVDSRRFEGTGDAAAEAPAEVPEDQKPPRILKVTFKLHDKKAAIAELNRMHGWIIDRKEVGDPGDFSKMPDKQLRQELEARLAARGMTRLQIKRFLDAGKKTAGG